MAKFKLWNYFLYFYLANPNSNKFSRNVMISYLFFNIYLFLVSYKIVFLRVYCIWYINEMNLENVLFKQSTVIISYFRENDRVVAINNVVPRTVEEAVATIRDAGKHIQVEVVRGAGQLQPAPSPRPPPAPASEDREQRSVRRGDVVTPGHYQGGYQQQQQQGHSYTR